MPPTDGCNSKGAVAELLNPSVADLRSNPCLVRLRALTSVHCCAARGGGAAGRARLAQPAAAAGRAGRRRGRCAAVLGRSGRGQRRPVGRPGPGHQWSGRTYVCDRAGAAVRRRRRRRRCGGRQERWQWRASARRGRRRGRGEHPTKDEQCAATKTKYTGVDWHAVRKELHVASGKACMRQPCSELHQPRWAGELRAKQPLSASLLTAPDPCPECVCQQIGMHGGQT